jgi:hypothetical protein
MDVVLDGSLQGEAAFLRIIHQSQGYGGSPEVAVIYASGYVRLKQNANPDPTIPFGSSFVFGPAYWSGPGTYHHNPQLTNVEIDTRWLPTGPLRMQVEGSNGAFELSYELALPRPRDRQTRLHVNQTYTATADVTVDPSHRARSEGFKLVQVSSMYVNEGATCDGGHFDCHDSNAARFVGANLARHQVAFADVVPSAFIYSPTLPLGSTWFDALHNDNTSWQGNTPNVRIALDALPANHTVTPQGWIEDTTNPDHDNVGLWLHDDGPASQHWTAGQSAQVGYWLLAQDDPPEPWADLGLRTGRTFLDFEDAFDCSFVHSETVTGTVEAILGYSDRALQLNYDLGDEDGNWAQVRCDFESPLDLSAYDHLRFDWRGDPVAANSIEVGLIDQVGATHRIFARGYPHVTHKPWWGQLVIPYSFLHPWHGGTLDSEQVIAFFVSVVRTDGAEDTGGAGSLAIDNLNAFSVAGGLGPSTPEVPIVNAYARTRAARWLVAQQRTTGLLKSWVEEAFDAAHIYDQALALIVFSREGMWSEADALVGALALTQNDDGSWFKSYNSDDASMPCVHCYKWEGDVAWAVYALSRYLAQGGVHSQARVTMLKGADWLTTHVVPNGCLAKEHTEGTLDVWWALEAAGWDYRGLAGGLEECLLTYYWDDEAGRFKGGYEWWQPYLDNQTWGAAFLQAVGQEKDAQRALDYAYQVLRLPGRGGQVYGFDGQGGPWSVWNEGTGQYVAVGGGGVNDLLQELLAQQRRDGAMPGSPDDLLGGGVWTTRWHGVAPTAWLYFALYPGEPFHATRWIWLPVTLKQHP